MDRAEVLGLVDLVDGVTPTRRDLGALRRAAAASARLRAWLDGCDVVIARELACVTPSADVVLAAAARTSCRDAARVVERARLTEAVPALGGALAAGEVSGSHVDVIAKALRTLEPGQRGLLTDEPGWLVGIATSSTPDQLRRALADEVRQLQADGGLGQHERQRRATRLRHWVDDEGMWCLFGRFDPETGLVLHRRLGAAVDTLFAQTTPDLAPSDPLERQDFLRAHALLALSEGRGAGHGRPEGVVVLDTTPPTGPVVDWGLPVELPLDVLRRWFALADVHGVVVRDGAVLHAPGTLDLGRTTRVANRPQRRALRAIYPTCAIPGCDTRFDLCKIHHVVWWRDGGCTDLANLLPICVRHHHAVHDSGWQLHLARDRTLTITYPDASSQTARPPPRRRC